MGGHHHTHVPAGTDRHGRKSATQRVALVSALVNILLSVVKLVVGVLAQSAALIADGIHSVSDLLSDALVWFAAHHAAQEPDDEHPYGHGRFETAATLGLGMLLVLVALGIVWDAVERTFYGDLVEPGSIALYAAAFSIIVNEGLYWYTLIVARRINSEMLRANAWHHRTDAISSVVVLIGVGGAIMGWTYLDALAAIIVGAMVARIGWDLGWDAMQELVDTSLDDETVMRARKVIQGVDGVRSLHLLRTRKHGPEASADVHVQVSPHLSVTEGHMISQVVEDRLKDEIDEIADVTVHIDPENDEQGPRCRGLPLRGDALTTLHLAWKDIEQLPKDYDITLHYISGRIDIDVILRLDDYSASRHADLREKLAAKVAPVKGFGEIRVMYR